MSLPFVYVCDLLQRLYDNRSTRNSPRSNSSIIEEWFSQHKRFIIQDQYDVAPLLSTLLPEQRSDRVYGLQEPALQRLVGRALLLGVSRLKELGRWKQPGSGVDLADCVEAILQITPNPTYPSLAPVTVGEVDRILHKVAAGCRFSSSAVRASQPQTHSHKSDSGLASLYTRLSARDAKWLTRLVLKNYQPVVLDPRVVYRACHPLLPTILKVQDDFTVASQFLRRYYQKNSAESGESLGLELRPTLGVKVGRQLWLKGRSIKHCLDMSFGKMSCEEKIDGEYCQIHIDLAKGQDCIQIFSKSGKDSTRDRVGVHDAIRNSLQIGQPSCPMKKGCILEGELVVYSEREDKILDFHKIRKHVSRSGSFLGTAMDSQAHGWERLMIVYFDVLAVDDQSLLGVRHSERFARLGDLVTCRKGASALVKRQIIDCNDRNAASDLRRAFARCITERREGLVLKADDPYFNLGTVRRPLGCSCIKLKKEYVGNFGDVGDFAVVGGRYDAATAKTYGIPNLKWTHFFVGCLENREQVRRWGDMPEFTVTNVVQLSTIQMKFFVSHVNPWSAPASENKSISLKIAPGIDNGRGPSIVFTDPPVFDIRCFSFEKAGNTGFWSPRFPAVSKMHCDRSYMDAVTFQDLQDMARAEKETALPADSKDLSRFIAALERADPGVPAGEMSQSAVSTTSTRPTPSPRKSSGLLPTECLPQNDPNCENEPLNPRRQKRPQEPSEAPRQLQKKQKHACRSLSSPAQPSPPAKETCREPLADITATSQPRGTGSVSPGTGVSESPPSCAPSAKDSMEGQGQRACVYRPETCALKGMSFLLSPCISQTPYLTEDLLSAHGVEQVVLDPEDWKNGGHVAQGKKPRRLKKTVLVESRRKEATRTFLQRIEQAGLQRRGGQREFVPVFDWKIVEVLTGEEGSGRGEGRDNDTRLGIRDAQSIWKRHWIGLA